LRKFCAGLTGLAILFSSVSGHAAGKPVETLTITFDEALATALGNNLGLANAGIEVSRTSKDQAIVDRRRLPEISLDGRYTRLEDPGIAEIPVPGYSIPDSETDLALVAKMPVWTGGRLSTASRQASAGVELTKTAEKIVRQNLLLETATAFYGLLAAQKFVEITGESLASSRQHLTDVKALLERGQVAKADLFRTDLNVAERERDEAEAEANLVMRAEHLASLLFPDRIVDLRARWEPAEPDTLPTVQEWMALAEEHSPDILSARLDLDLATEGTAAARAERFPNVGLFGSYGTRDERFSYGDDDRYWNAGLALTVPLFRGGRTGLEIGKSEEGEAQASNSLVTVRRGVRRGLVDAHAGTVLALRQFAAAEKAVISAEENHRVTRLKYREGLVPNIDVMDALLSLSRARFDRIESLRNYYTNRTRLMRLAGTIEEIL